jgi:hypothetical protein
MRIVSITCIIAIFASSQGLAQSLTDGNSDPIVQNYVEAYGISPEEARRRMAYVQQAADLQQRLQAEEPVRFGGLYIEQQPSFRVVVKLVGGANQLLSRYTTDPVFVAEKAPFPLKALRNKQEALAKRLGQDEPIFGTDIDVRSGRVKLYIPNPANVRAKLKGASISDEDVDIVQSAEIERTAATVQGGEATTYMISSTTETATLGFNVTDGTTKGVLTAAHFGECAGRLSGCVVNGASKHTPSGVSLTFKGQQNAGSNDYEWRTAATGNTFPNSLKYSSTSMTITSTRDPTAFPVGTTVCKQGATTGYTCGTIESTSSTSTYNGQTGTWVRVKRNTSGNMVEGGDSGGPVFGANTAYGIVHSKVTATGLVGQMHFMPITRISGLGLSVIVN